MRRVADAMLAPPVVVGRETTVQDASARMLDAHVHAAVVVDDGTICGLVTAEQVVEALAAGRDAADTLSGMIAERDMPVVPADAPLAEVHQRMRAEGHAVVPVVHDGAPVGVLEDPEAVPS